MSNPVCRASLDFGAKRGWPGAVVYYDWFSVKGPRVPVRCTGFGWRLVELVGLAALYI